MSLHYMNVGQVAYEVTCCLHAPLCNRCTLTRTNMSPHYVNIGQVAYEVTCCLHAPLCNRCTLTRTNVCLDLQLQCYHTNGQTFFSTIAYKQETVCFFDLYYFIYLNCKTYFIPSQFYKFKNYINLCIKECLTRIKYSFSVNFPGSNEVIGVQFIFQVLTK